MNLKSNCSKLLLACMALTVFGLSGAFGQTSSTTVPSVETCRNWLNQPNGSSNLRWNYDVTAPNYYCYFSTWLSLRIKYYTEESDMRADTNVTHEVFLYQFFFAGSGPVNLHSSGEPYPHNQNWLQPAADHAVPFQPYYDRYAVAFWSSAINEWGPGFNTLVVSNNARDHAFGQWNGGWTAVDF